VFFVDLAPVTAAGLLATTILQALSITGPAADAQTHLLRYLRDKHALLILDNFEQLAEVGAELLPKLLSAAPKVKLLVTSRVRLNLREEWLAPLAGMETPLEETRWGGSNPPPETARPPQRPVLASEGAAQLQPGDFQSLARYSATALFLACMRRVRPDFQPGDDDARQIVHICRLLDGMPLALELAAARTRALPLNEVARELEHGLNLLATKARDVPERQRSMTATFDYSWGLLSPHERSILRQASVFRGGFTREAAEATTGAALGDLDSLCDACWINLAASGRYDMHELARQYCAEKLAVEHAAESDETPDRVRNRHAIFFSTLLVAQSGQFFRRPAVISELT